MIKSGCNNTSKSGSWNGLETVMSHLKSLIKVLQHALFCHVCNRSLCVISDEAEMAEE